MKILSGILASSVLAMVVMGGCAMNPHHDVAAAPAIKVSTDHHNIDAGTSTRLTAESVNVVGGSDIKWSVSPNVGKVRVDGQHGTTAVFSADQQGTYSVTASVDLGNGHWVSDYTDITVNGVDANGHPISTNK